MYEIKMGREVVPAAGVEPARPLERQILSLLCLPIPPSRQPSKETNRFI